MPCMRLNVLSLASEGKQNDSRYTKLISTETETSYGILAYYTCMLISRLSKWLLYLIAPKYNVLSCSPAVNGGESKGQRIIYGGQSVVWISGGSSLNKKGVGGRYDIIK
jgi:hypothetical protein